MVDVPRNRVSKLDNTRISYVTGFSNENTYSYNIAAYGYFGREPSGFV